MVSSRLLYQNFLTASTFSAFDVAGGAVAMEASGWSPIYAYVAGTVIFTPTGTYTSPLDADYVVEIHVCPDGNFANTRWRWSDTGGASWNAQNLQPVDGQVVALNHGLSVQFTDSNILPQFVLGDYWFARAIHPHGIVKAFDGTRNSEYWSGTLPTSSTLRIGFDLGTAKSPTAAIIDDHNIPSNATVTWYAHPTTLFTETGGFSQSVTWRANRMVELITPSPFRYWWLKIAVGATAIDPLKLSGLFLGDGATLSQPPSIGASTTPTFLGNLDANLLANEPGPQVRTADRTRYTWFGRQRAATQDGGKLEAALAYATQHPTYQQPNFWFLLQDDDVTTMTLQAWLSLQRTHVFLDRYTYESEWTEVIRRVSS